MTGDGVDGATKTGCTSGIVALVVGDAVSGTGVVCTIVGGTDIVVGEVVGGGDPVTASVGAEVEGSVGARVGADVSLAVESPPNVLETSNNKRQWNRRVPFVSSLNNIAIVLMKPRRVRSSVHHVRLRKHLRSKISGLL